MSQNWWPPEHYLIAEGQAVVVPWRVASVLVGPAGLEKFQRAIRGSDPEVSNVLAALKTAGLRWRASVGESSAQKEPKAPASSRLGVTEVADLLGITPAAVRLACRQQRLAARKVSDRWSIERAEVEHFKARRHR